MNVEPDFRRLMIKIFLDIACLIAVAIPIFVYYRSDKIYHRGFFCDDLSLRHPYKDSTVPSWALYAVGLGLPIISILIVEFILYTKEPGNRYKIKLKSKKMPGWLWECYRHIGVFLFGGLCSQLVTDIAKYTVGRLRPHFFDICKPNIDCNDAKYKYMYITNYTCQQKNRRLLKDVRLSFPSGHSSFSFYCMLYLAMYIQKKMKWKGSKLLKHVLQYMCIVLALYTALTRISDYKHHWSDVLAGVIQGIIIAVLIIFYVAEFQQTTHKVEVPPPPSPHDLSMH